MCYLKTVLNHLIEIGRMIDDWSYLEELWQVEDDGAEHDGGDVVLEVLRSQQLGRSQLAEETDLEPKQTLHSSFKSSIIFNLVNGGAFLSLAGVLDSTLVAVMRLPKTRSV